MTVALDFEPDPIPKNAVGGSAAALGAAGTIVTVATAIAQASRIQCCLATICYSPETRTRLDLVPSEKSLSGAGSSRRTGVHSPEHALSIEHFVQRRYPRSSSSTRMMTAIVIAVTTSHQTSNSHST